MNENQLQTLLNAINTLQDLGKVAYFNKGNFNSQTEYEINDVVSYNGSSYVSLVNNNRGNLPTNTAFWSVVASKGDKGDTGKAFVIEKTYSTIEDMVDDYDNMEINDYVMIQGDVEAQENATLWTKREVESTPYRWTYLADFSGASGITGATPNIQIGTVTEGNQPSVTRRAGSTNENPILDFVLKTGATGATGATGNGISSVSKTGTSGLTDVYTIAYTNGGSDTFNVVNGKGIVSIQKTGSVDTVDTYTITYNDGTTSTFEVTNGEVTQAQLDDTNKEVERANMVYNALPKVSGEGTDITINNTAECPVYDIELSPSELEQETTTGKNLINMSEKTGSLNNDYYINFATDFTLTADTTYTLSFDANVSVTPFRLSIGCGVDTYRTDISDKRDLENGRVYITFTPTTAQLGNGNKLFIRCPRYASLTSATYTFKKFQLEISPSMTDYEEYTGGQPSPSPNYPQNIHVVTGENAIKIKNSDNTQEQTYPISLGNLEYCKTGDYEDEFYKATESDTGLTAGKWYLKKSIGKNIFTGAIEENWTSGATSPAGNYRCISTMIQNLVLRPSSANVKIPMFSNYYIAKTYNETYLREKGVSIGSNGYLGIYDNNFVTDNISLYTTWLSTHNLILYYPLATPTYTLLNSTLQTQLDNLSKAISYQEQTNVSQTNADLPFVIKMSAIRDMSGIFELIQE